jgi:hypothetical protein
MRPFNSLIVAGLLLGAMQAAQAQQTSDLERIHAASRQFVAAIVARDINTMDAVWAHESYASFIGPLSTSVVVGWAGVRQAWQMRFGQFEVPSRNLHRLTCGTHSPLFVSVNMELIPSGGDYDPSFRGTARPRGGEIGADDLRVDVDLGASEAEEVPLSHVSARAVEAVRLLMINSLNLETLMKVIPKRRFVGVDDRALRNPSADE